MSTAPDPADTVIEQAAKVIMRHFNPSPHGGSWRLDPSKAARALVDSGLLADPADRGFDGANEAFTWRERALHWKADKERAEAEVVELRRNECGDRDVHWRYDDAVSTVAELRATIARVRVAAHGWSRSADPGCASIGDQFLSMLDGAGDAS